MCHSYRSKLSLYESLSSVTEPFEVIVILDLTEYSLRLNWSPASMHQAFSSMRGAKLLAPPPLYTDAVRKKKRVVLIVRFIHYLCHVKKVEFMFDFALLI